MSESFFTKHLHDANESYIEHLVFTIKAGSTLIAAGVIVMIHGLFPFVFTHTGSNMICRLTDEMKTRKQACQQRCTAKNPPSE
ncbi:MAG: hypothetical protein HYS17_05435 [Micavibrio aeruginosavorus]|uniref:Capsule biosynthesis protein n=1 Tax=Micavibrio aeruginosavorus TaxID=349221 RepID=A0A7T5UHE7_9BACT|nr:MAG: hypothetical protein HYS17_05435 [Micavibrio aeruginosavorus]